MWFALEVAISGQSVKWITGWGDCSSALTGYTNICRFGRRNWIGCGWPMWRDGDPAAESIDRLRVLHAPIFTASVKNSE